MREFAVRFHSFQDVQEFVALAGMESFTILVGNESYRVSGTSFMGMFTLDHTKPMRVMMECSLEEFEGFRQKAARFLDHN